MILCVHLFGMRDEAFVWIAFCILHFGFSAGCFFWWSVVSYHTHITGHVMDGR